jgi:hypothetical protein
VCAAAKVIGPDYDGIGNGLGVARKLRVHAHTRVEKFVIARTGGLLPVFTGEFVWAARCGRGRELPDTRNDRRGPGAVFSRTWRWRPNSEQIRASFDVAGTCGAV